MGASKTKHYKPGTIQLALIARAMAHPARIQILDAVQDCNQIFTCIELSRIVQLSPSTVHHHLQIMLEGRIIEFDFESQCYIVSPVVDRIRELIEFLDS